MDVQVSISQICKNIRHCSSNWQSKNPSELRWAPYPAFTLCFIISPPLPAKLDPCWSITSNDLLVHHKQRWWNLSCSASSFGTIRNVFDNGDSFTVENQNESLRSVPFGALDAEITPETADFFVSGAEGDPDCSTKGFASIEQAINTLKKGKFVIVVDDKNEVEGNLIIAASLTTPEAMAFMVKHGSGIVSVGMKVDDLEKLKLTLMSPDSEDVDSLSPTFTVTVDAKLGTTTGASASDRARTVVALASPQSKPKDFRRPGHVFPLKYRNGGVLGRAGHTEASVDLMMLAGLRPVSVLSAIVDQDDGSIASLDKLRKLASDYKIPMVLITDLIRYRRKSEKLVERMAVSRLPTK